MCVPTVSTLITQEFRPNYFNQNRDRRVRDACAAIKRAGARGNFNEP